ncbi:phage major capsid protein [Acinetobacter baumannii]
MTEKTLEQLAQEFQKHVDTVKGYAEEFKGKYEKNEQISQSAKDKADEALTAMNEMKNKVAEIEQKAARRGNGETETKKQTMGGEFVETTEYKNAAEAQYRGIQRVELKNTIGTTEVGKIIPATNLGLKLPNQMRLTIRDILAGGSMSGNVLEYVQMQDFTNNAAVVAEGAPKPESAITFTDKDAKAVVIAHWLKVTTQMLSDAPALQSFIDNILRHGLDIKLEKQILAGDGTNGNMLGLIPQATAYAPPAGAPATPNMFDVLRFAMLQVVLADDFANGHVLNPIDWALMETQKDANGNYIIGNPQSQAVPTLWGLPVVQTAAMDAGKFLTGAFNTSAQYFERWGAAVQIGMQGDDFTSNKRTLLAETRGALAVYKPKSLVYGSYTPATGG